MNATVYITNKSATHDYVSAARHGALRFVTTGNYPIFKTARLQEEIIEALAHSSADDFLLFSGSSAVAALCVSVWMEMHGTVKVLLWDRTQDQYVLRVLCKKDMQIEIERTRDLMMGRTKI